MFSKNYKTFSALPRRVEASYPASIGLDFSVNVSHLALALLDPLHDPPSPLPAYLDLPGHFSRQKSLGSVETDRCSSPQEVNPFEAAFPVDSRCLSRGGQGHRAVG